MQSKREVIIINTAEIIEYLEDNDLEEIKEVKMKDGVVGLKFKYTFDPLEVQGAQAYANDECNSHEKTDEWYEDFFLPYLTEMALDNAGDIVEECAEEYEMEYELISLDLSKENYDYNLFLVAFYNDVDFQIEDYLSEII